MARSQPANSGARRAHPNAPPSSFAGLLTLSEDPAVAVSHRAAKPLARLTLADLQAFAGSLADLALRVLSILQPEPLRQTLTASAASLAAYFDQVNNDSGIRCVRIPERVNNPTATVSC
jgi:hypothetical protein